MAKNCLIKSMHLFELLYKVVSIKYFGSSENYKFIEMGLTIPVLFCSNGRGVSFCSPTVIKNIVDAKYYINSTFIWPRFNLFNVRQIYCLHGRNNIYVLFSLDSFVNSQEWTLSRSVPDLKLVSYHQVFVDCLCLYCPTWDLINTKLIHYI